MASHDFDVLIVGSGLANLHNARKGKVPVVNIVGDHATHHTQYDAQLQSDIETVARNVSPGFVRTSQSTAALCQDAADAITAARGLPGQVATLILPADVSWGEVAKLNDVFLYTVDDIAAVVEVGKEERRAAADTAEDIIHAHTQEFARWLEGRDAVPVIRALRDEAERVRRHTLDAALKRLHKGDAAEDVLTALSQQLTNKLLHPPLQALNTSQGDTRTQLVGLVAKLYNLHPD